jgi:hypothetical protein
LPAGETEVGAWAIGVNATGGEDFQPAAMSWSIPLAAGEEPDVNYLKEGEGETAECPGTAKDPEAAPGELCVYTLQESEIQYIAGAGGFPAVTVAGAGLFFQVKPGGVAFGTFAVTAEE